MNGVARQSDTQYIKSQLSSFVSVNDIADLRNTVVPTINSFRGVLEKFTKEHSEMKLCIKQFDNDICIKANK